MSLREFGKAIGVSRQTVNNWERGVSLPLTEILFKIKWITTDEWARQLAMDCLSLRFPDQLINRNNHSTEPVN